MSVRVGYASCIGGNIHRDLHCSSCERLLGSYDKSDNMEISDIEGWIFCPYCGRELEEY